MADAAKLQNNHPIFSDLGHIGPHQPEGSSLKGIPEIVPDQGTVTGNGRIVAPEIRQYSQKGLIWDEIWDHSRVYLNLCETDCLKYPNCSGISSNKNQQEI
jgi:hypothetical protein